MIKKKFSSNKKSGDFYSKNNQLYQADKSIIFGRHPCFQALLNKNRKIYQIFTTKNLYESLVDFLQKNKLNYQHFIKIVDKNHLENLVGKNQNHQNLIVVSSKLKIYNQNDLLEALYNDNSFHPNILILDQITDPHNVGAIMRNAAAFGFNYLVFSEFNSIQENSTIIKSSAGAIEFLKLFVATNINDLLKKLKKFDYWCIALAGEGHNDIEQINQFSKKVIVVGSEGNGIRQLVKRNCDLICKINISDKVESLNVSNALAIALYQASKNDKV